MTDQITKLYYTLEEAGRIRGLKPTKVRYLVEVLKIPFCRNRRGTIKIHRREYKRYFA